MSIRMMESQLTSARPHWECPSCKPEGRPSGYTSKVAQTGLNACAFTLTHPGLETRVRRSRFQSTKSRLITVAMCSSACAMRLQCSMRKWVAKLGACAFAPASATSLRPHTTLASAGVPYGPAASEGTQAPSWSHASAYSLSIWSAARLRSRSTAGLPSTLGSVCRRA